MILPVPLVPLAVAMTSNAHRTGMAYVAGYARILEERARARAPARPVYGS